MGRNPEEIVLFDGILWDVLTDFDNFNELEEALRDIGINSFNENTNYWPEDFGKKDDWDDSYEIILGNGEKILYSQKYFHPDRGKDPVKVLYVGERPNAVKVRKLLKLDRRNPEEPFERSIN